MIFGFVALLIAGLAYYFYSKSISGGIASANTALTPPTDDTYAGSEGVKVGNTIFVTKLSPAMQKAADAGATAYKLDDPDVVARRQDALDREKASAALALQSHLIQTVTVPEADAGSQAAATGLNDTLARLQALANGAPMTNVQPGISSNIGDTPRPAQYWDATHGRWVSVQDSLATPIGPRQIA